jgi:hypothetical protein
MSEWTGVQDVQWVRALGGLRITPQRFLDAQQNIGRPALSTTDKIAPILIRPRPGVLPFTALWEIDLDVLNNKLRTTLDPLGVGYCYLITRGRTIMHHRTFGWAQLDKDGDVGWSLNTPMNVASVSKFVTAIAIVRLLSEAKIAVKTPIAGFLPQYWTQGSGVSRITFHDLLRHESGLGKGISKQGTGTFAEARTEIGTGSTATGTYDYKNVNFAILRILFATLTGTLSPSDTVPEFLGVTNDVAWDVLSASALRFS